MQVKSTCHPQETYIGVSLIHLVPPLRSPHPNKYPTPRNLFHDPPFYSFFTQTYSIWQTLLQNLEEDHGSKRMADSHPFS